MSRILLLLLTVIFSPRRSDGRIGFVKDQSTMAEFPPTLTQVDDMIPVGHLRPLGWQRDSDGEIADEFAMPSPADFHKHYLSKQEPSVFRNTMKDAPAIKHWTEDIFLQKHYGNLKVHIIERKKYFDNGSKDILFDRFLKDHHYDDIYLSNIMPIEMMKEFTVPKCLKCGSYSKMLLESHLWMSSGGTSSLLHSHKDHMMYCVVSGRRDFITIHPKYKDGFDYKVKESGEGYSRIDMEMINMFTYAQIAETPWKHSILAKGDCIYIPAGYLHQVRSHGRSISSAILWGATKKFSDSGCQKDTLEKTVFFSDMQFLWTYRNGEKQLFNTHLNAASLRQHLLVLLRDKPLLKLGEFALFYNQIMSKMKKYVKAENVFKMISKGHKAYISREEIQTIDEKDLEKVAEILNTPHKIVHDEL